MLEALAATVPHLPADRPRYLMGVGDPVGMLEAIALGVDQFDCVAPTRMARHGSMLTTAGRLNLRNAVVRPRRPARSTRLCACTTCARWSRGYLRHLLLVGEPTAWRLLSIHNLAFVLGLMTEARPAIAGGRFDELRARTAEVWGGLRPAAPHPELGLGYSRDRRAHPRPPPPTSMMAALGAGRRRWPATPAKKSSGSSAC